MAKPRAYVVLGMKRSGHHAILHWICYNFKAAVHYNDYKIHNKDFIPAHPHQKPVVFGEGAKNVRVYNCEDFDWSNLGRLQTLPIWDKYNVTFLSVIRDPFNWLASSLRAGGGLAKRIPKRIKLYQQQVKLFGCTGVVPVNYNRWVKEEAYRELLGERLNLPSIDKGVRTVSPRGGGSSFDKLKFKNKAQDMDVFGRWREYVGNPLFQMLLNDEELQKINNHYFHIHMR